jgi:hypothetical protein
MRWPVVGLLATAAVVAWLLMRDTDAPAERPTPGSAKTTGPAKISAPDNPALPPRPSPSLSPSASAQPSTPATGPTAEDDFQTETRDDDWAKETEAELAKRFKRLRAGKIESTECRQSQCRVVIGGSTDDVATAVADLEGPRGLHGYAKDVRLTSPTTNDDGSVALRVFVRFAR